MYYIFSVRPLAEENKDKFETNTKYCHYDEAHDDYLYQEDWVRFIVNIFESYKFTKLKIKKLFTGRQKLNEEDYPMY